MKTNPALSAYSDQDLLKELISRNNLMPAPTRTRRYGEHKEALVAIGPDEVASIVLTQDALAALVDEMRVI